MSISRHTRAARWGGALLVALAPLPWLGMGTAVANPAGQPGNESKVTICHRTNSVSNPYVVIRVAQSSVDGDLGNNNGRGDHYAEHRGPIFDPEVDYPKPMSGDEWGDIIPPIEGVHDGLNWTIAGIDIYYNDCNVGGPSPSESESSEDVSPSESESSEDVSPSESESSEDVSPSESESKEQGKPPSSALAEATETESSAGARPQTGSGAPVAGALGISLLLIGIGVLLLLGPGRLMPTTYHRKH